MNDDQKRAFDDCKNEIIMIKNWIKANPLDSNVKFLVAYAVIKSSGTIEVVFKSMMHLFLSDNCKNETKLFLEKNIVDMSYNPNTGNMEKILDQIDPNRKQIFNDMYKNSQEKSDLNSLVSLRNDIAHGRDITSSINSVEKFFLSGIKIIESLDEILYSHNSADNT